MQKRQGALKAIRGTGPRTLAGKARSKFNALKHGILSSAVVLQTECAGDYAQLVSGLFECLQPDGKLEEALVEKIASALWRQRRLLQAEAAEIGHALLNGQKTLADKISHEGLAEAFWPDRGSVQTSFVSNNGSGMLEAAKSLAALGSRILSEGLGWTRDQSILRELFGKQEVEKPKNPRSIPFLYRELSFDNVGNPKDTNRESVQALTGGITEVVEFLKDQAESVLERAEALEALGSTASFVPPPETVERLVRYEAHLDRVLDRALAQLERLQRLRFGHPVLPALRVEVSR